MSYNNPINLNENKDLQVKVIYPNHESEYTNIRLKYGSAPQILLRGDLQDKEIIVQAINDNRYDTYYISDIHTHNFFTPSIFRYLYMGKADKDNLKTVHFTIPELASYFHRELNYEIDHDVNITGNLKIEPLEAKLENIGLCIKIHQGYSLKSNEDHTGFTFKNIIFFSFESETALSFNDIENLMYKAIRLLTWIIGYPVSVDSINVSDGENSGYLYLPMVKKLSKHDTNFPNSFMHSHLFREHFQIICNNFFIHKELFNDIWSRTIPLFDFTGVLEYEVMLYASILDKYFSHKINELNLYQATNENIDITGIEDFLKNNEDFRNLLTDQSLIEKIDVAQLFNIQKFQTLVQKQKTYFKYIGAKNLKIFINNNDFYNIKSIRDRAAHGVKEQLSTSKVQECLWKVKLLTMYFIYSDLGIKEDDFFKIISSTIHPTVKNCEIDQQLLDLKVGRTIFVKMNQSEIDKVEKLGIKTKVLDKQNDIYLFNYELSKMIQDYFKNDINSITENKTPIFYSYIDYMVYLLEQKKINKKAKFYNQVYIEQKNNKKLIHNVIILS